VYRRVLRRFEYENAAAQVSTKGMPPMSSPLRRDIELARGDKGLRTDTGRRSADASESLLGTSHCMCVAQQRLPGVERARLLHARERVGREPVVSGPTSRRPRDSAPCRKRADTGPARYRWISLSAASIDCPILTIRQPTLIVWNMPAHRTIRERGHRRTATLLRPHSCKRLGTKSRARHTTYSLSARWPTRSPDQAKYGFAFMPPASTRAT